MANVMKNSSDAHDASKVKIWEWEFLAFFSSLHQKALHIHRMDTTRLSPSRIQLLILKAEAMLGPLLTCLLHDAPATATALMTVATTFNGKICKQ